MDSPRSPESGSYLNVVLSTKNRYSWIRTPLSEKRDPVKTVVIGNGPSLNDHLTAGDFTLLQQLQDDGLVETWSMNLIDLLYPRTDWRPSNWVWVEHITYDKALGSHREATIEYAGEKVWRLHIDPKDEVCWIETRFRKWIDPLHWNEADSDPVNWISRCEGTGHNCQYGDPAAPDDWHLPELCVYGGSMNTALSLVYQLGARDVAVIGCDLGIEKPVRGKAGQWKDSNHFDPDYLTWMDGDYSLADATLEDVHRMARKNFEADGRSIVNAGIGGKLGMYDRKSLSEFLEV